MPFYTVHSLKYAQEVLKRLKEAVVKGANDPAKIKANVIATMKEIASELGDGLSIIDNKELRTSESTLKGRSID